MTRDELIDLQWRKLTAGLERIRAGNRFYHAKFRAAGLVNVLPRSLQDFRQFPFTTKEELLLDQEQDPLFGGNFARPLREYCRIHQTSGSRGRPLRWLDTADSWNWILDCWSAIYRAIGLRPDDRLFFPFSFGPFLGFWAAFEGASRLGHFVIPAGGINTQGRLRLLLELQATIVFCTPTYALRMAEVAQEQLIDLAASPVRALVLAGEPGGNIPATRARLESAWSARIFDHWGMTELGSLGIEYADDPGKLYLLEDQVIAEFIDSATGSPVAEGELGELVVTNLGRWDCPLVRYRTGDLVRWRSGQTPVGQPFVHLDGGILSRVNDMIWIKGNNVFPAAIEALLREFPQIAEFAIEVDETRTAPRLTIQIRTNC